MRDRHRSLAGLVLIGALLLSASVVVSIPVLVGFLSVQRYLIRGLPTGAVN